MSKDDIVVRWLDEPKRGPGGHWHHYEARKGDVVGYGDTEREARQALRERESR